MFAMCFVLQRIELDADCMYELVSVVGMLPYVSTSLFNRNQSSNTSIMRAFIIVSGMLEFALYAFAQGQQPCYNAAAPNMYV
jgi:hypothetical protein